MLKKLERNVKIIYGIAFFHSLLIIVPVIVPFFMSKGLSLAEIFYLQAIYAATIVLLEAPSGYLADIFGRRNALLIGGMAHGLGYLCLNFATDLNSLIVFEILAGAAASLLSGADLAVLYDSQKAIDAQRHDQAGSNKLSTTHGEHSGGIANLGFMRSAAEASGALLGGLAAMQSYELMVLMQSASAWMCLILAFFVVEPPYKTYSDNGSKVQQIKISQVLAHMLNSDPVLRQLVIAIPLYGLATFHAAWLIQPYWESQGIPLVFFGVLWCVQSLVVAVGNKAGFILERRFGAVFTLCIIGALPVIGHLGLALANNWLGILLGFFLFAGRGLYQVILTNALNRRVPSEFRATANSFTSFLFRLSFIATGPVIGYFAEAAGLAASLQLLAAASVVLFVLVMMPLIRSVQHLEKREHELLEQQSECSNETL